MILCIKDENRFDYVATTNKKFYVKILFVAIDHFLKFIWIYSKTSRLVYKYVHLWKNTYKKNLISVTVKTDNGKEFSY